MDGLRRRIPDWRTLVFRYGMVWLLIALLILAQIVSPHFFDIQNLKNILQQNSPVGLVAIGMTFVIIAGGFDLSVAAVAGLGGVLLASFGNHMGIPAAYAATIACGLLAGAINAFVVTVLRVNPFVATLGTSSVFTGFALLYSHSLPIVNSKAGFDTLGATDILGIPLAIFVLAAALLVGGFVLAKSVYGREVYAVGGNDEAARLAGIRVNVTRSITYIISGGCAVLAGMIFTSQTGTGQADLAGTLTLDSIAIVIIGGTSLFGGEGAIWRTLVGLLILATINNVFSTLGVQAAAQELVKGAIVIFAVALDSFARSRGY
jgi:ribose transport system permease protein